VPERRGTLGMALSTVRLRSARVLRCRRPPHPLQAAGGRAGGARWRFRPSTVRGGSGDGGGRVRRRPLRWLSPAPPPQVRGCCADVSVALRCLQRSIGGRRRLCRLRPPPASKKGECRVAFPVGGRARRRAIGGRPQATQVRSGSAAAAAGDGLGPDLRAQCHAQRYRGGD